jgi:hypothetical protein
MMRQISDSKENTEFSRVEAALKSLQPTPKLDPEIFAAGRQAFLVEARAFSAQAVMPEPISRRKGWSVTLQNLLALRLRKAPLMALVKIILIAGLLFGSTIGTVSASQDSLPGSVLYPLKLQLEDWRFARTIPRATGTSAIGNVAGTGTCG